MTAENRVAFFLPEVEDEVQNAEQGLKIISGQAATADTASSAVTGEGHMSMISSKYGRVSMDYFEVAEHGLKTPVNQNKGQAFKKYIPLLKFGVPILLGLGFLAWF